MEDNEYIKRKLKENYEEQTKDDTKEYSEEEIDNVNLDSKNIFDSYKESQTYQKELEKSSDQ